MPTREGPPRAAQFVLEKRGIVIVVFETVTVPVVDVYGVFEDSTTAAGSTATHSYENVVIFTW